MPPRDAFSPQLPEFERFLFADIGMEPNGTMLCLVSVFGRLGSDPWTEAGRLARLPPDEATRSLAGTIAAMPASLWPLPEAASIAARLIALLPRGAPPSPGPAKRRPRFALQLTPKSLRIALVVASMGLAGLVGLWMSHQAYLGAASSDRIVSFDAIPKPPRSP